MSWVLAFHIISVVTWFSGLFYLPRLFVYHAMSTDQTSKERFVIMERKLLNGITTPSAIATLTFGAWLVSFNPDYYMSSSWFHWKLMLVIILVFYHLLCYRFTLTFRADQNTRSHTFYRYFNEFPVLLLVGIVILVTVKPG
ncbi:MAG: protoporphyrinogen oxidase HemJ [Pseudomonadales bacterium]|nr:protoporphyrinogen oxidase HemJ [Pseudomonadales bacterium]